MSLDHQKTPRETSRRRLGRLLAVVFVAAMLMGLGPGVMLIREPGYWFGLPRIYVWALIWFTVEAGVVVAAYLFVWRGSEQIDKHGGEGETAPAEPIDIGEAPTGRQKL